MPKHSQEHGNCGKSSHANKDVENNTYYDTWEDICYKSGWESRYKCQYSITGATWERLHQAFYWSWVKTINQEQEAIKVYASKVVRWYQWVQNFEYYTGLAPRLKTRMKTPHKVALSIETSLKEELHKIEKEGYW